MNFANVKSLTIPEGSVKKITINGVDVWSKGEEPVPSDPWEALFYSINRGTYKTDYEVGDLIPLDMGAEGSIHMQIAGFDCDTLAAGGNYAAVSLISKELLATSHEMNTQDTGSVGDWEHSEMRAYMKNTIKPLIPANIRSSIVEVTKTSYAYDTSGTSFHQTTQDDVWIPSTRDLAYSDKKEKSGPMYSTVYPDLASHKKSKVDSSRAIGWWLRSAANNMYNFCHVNPNSGDWNSGSADSSYGVVLGFCVGVGAPLPSAAMLLNTITRPTAYNPALDDGEDIPDEQALNLITGGEN